MPPADPAIPVREACRFTGDDSPSFLPRATLVRKSVRFHHEHRAAAVGHPDATPVAVGTPGVILAARRLTQPPPEPNPSYRVSPTIGIPPPLRFTGDRPLPPMGGAVCQLSIFPRHGVQILSRSPAEGKKSHNQESKRSAAQEFLHSNLLALVFPRQDMREGISVTPNSTIYAARCNASTLPSPSPAI